MTFVHQSIAPNAEVLNLPLTTAGGAITIPANTVYLFTVSLTSGSCTIVTDTDPQTTLTIASNSQNPYESPNLNGGRINHSITITPNASCDGFVSEAKVISSAPALSLDITPPTATLVGAIPAATTGIAATVTIDFDDETAFNPASVTIGSLSAVDGANVATIAIANTTAIGNNGVRVDFDVTAPADGNYTVTVPVNSYADVAGNQGALVNLGTMTAAAVTFANLTASNTLNAVLAGQSNALRMQDNGFQSELNAATPATVVQVYSAEGATGFENGTGAWRPGSVNPLLQNLIDALNAAKASADANTVFSPILWLQIEKDSDLLVDTVYYKEQFLLAKKYLEDNTGLQLNWLFYQFNVNAVKPFVTEARAAIAEIVAENSDVYLVDTDDQTLEDTVHYPAATYDVLRDRGFALADANSLYKTLAQASFTPSVNTPSGVVFDLGTISEAPGADVSTITPAVGSTLTAENGSFVVSPSGSAIVNSGADPGGVGWYLSSSESATGTVTRVEVQFFFPSGTQSAGVVFRRGSVNAYPFDSYFILVSRQATNTLRAVPYELNSFAGQTGANIAIPGDNLYNIEIEYSLTTFKYRLNGSAVIEDNITKFASRNEVAIRLTNPLHELRALTITGQAGFTI